MNHVEPWGYRPLTKHHRTKLSVAQKKRLGIPPMMSRVYGTLLEAEIAKEVYPMVAEISRLHGRASAEAKAKMLTDLSLERVRDVIKTFQRNRHAQIQAKKDVRRQQTLEDRRRYQREYYRRRQEARGVQHRQKQNAESAEFRQMAVDLWREDVPIEDIAEILAQPKARVKRWVTNT